MFAYYRLSGGGDNGSSTKIRNAAVVNATKQTRGDADTIKKREELQRRIEETRRKLQSVSDITFLVKCYGLPFNSRRMVRLLLSITGWLQVVVENQPKHIRLEQPYTGETSPFE